jgi:hypothetical protein
MSNAVLKGNASGTGTVTLETPNTNSDFTISLPAATGNMVVAGANSALVSGTAVDSTSGTSIDFTSIPSWVKRVTVMFIGVSANGSSPLLLQIGSGSVTTSGYAGSCFSVFASSGFGVSNSTAGFLLGTDSLNGYSRRGSVVLTNQRNNVWVCSGILAQNDTARANMMGGSVSLSSTLDRVRITTVNGTDAFDAGSINILYE